MLWFVTQSGLRLPCCYSIVHCCRAVLIDYFVVSLNSGLQGLSMGRPRPLRPATDLHERLQSLAGFHATGALPDEAGPRAVQGPGVHPEEEIQGHREAVNAQEYKPKHWQRETVREVCCVCLCVCSCVSCLRGRDKNILTQCEHLWGYKRKTHTCTGHKNDKHWGTHEAFNCVSTRKHWSRMRGWKQWETVQTRHLWQ